MENRMKYFKLVKQSSNSKIGKIACTYSSKNTCPDSCGLKDAGCYAQKSFVNMIWQKLSDGNDHNSSNWKDHLNLLKQLPEGSMLRMNVAGDLQQTKRGKLNKTHLNALINATSHLKKWAYTHVRDPQTIREANAKGFSLIASLDDFSQLPYYKGCPTATIIDSSFERKGTIKHGYSETLNEWHERTKDNLKKLKKRYKDIGVTLKLCPAQHADEMNCEKCGLCGILKPDYSIGFAAHGSSKSKINVV